MGCILCKTYDDTHFPPLGYLNVIGDDCFRLIQQSLGRYDSLVRTILISQRTYTATNRHSAIYNDHLIIPDQILNDTYFDYSDHKRKRLPFLFDIIPKFVGNWGWIEPKIKHRIYYPFKSLTLVDLTGVVNVFENERQRLSYDDEWCILKLKHLQSLSVSCFIECSRDKMIV